MKCSLVINTAAGDASIRGSNPWRSAGYAERAELLQQQVLPPAVAAGFHEVIVAGCWKAGDGYKYVPVEPLWRDRRDALWQREVGARYATGDVLIFCHDDHALADGFLPTLRRNWLEAFDGPAAPEWDLLVPRRIHGLTAATLNNGSKDSYMGGHALVMRRWLWAQVPWTSVDMEYWDVSMTRLWREAGGKIVFADDLVHIDVEAAEHES